MPFIVGRKIKMDQMWDEQGNVNPMTIISAGPVVITQIKGKEKDGYEAFQVGYDNSAKHISKALSGHLKNLGKFRHIKEFRKTDEKENYQIGDTIDFSSFAKGDIVSIVGYE